MKLFYFLAITLFSVHSCFAHPLDDELEKTLFYSRVANLQGQEMGRVLCSLHPQIAQLNGNPSVPNGISEIYCANYPQGVIVHPYSHFKLSIPFSATLPYTSLSLFPAPVQALVKHHKVEPRIYVIVQEYDSTSPQCLRPHYLLHTHAGSHGGKGKTHIHWRAMTADGTDMAATGNRPLGNMDLISEQALTHPAGDGVTVLSPNNMKLKAIPAEEGKAFYSFIIPKKQAHLATLTFHWLLPKKAYPLRGALLEPSIRPSGWNSEFPPELHTFSPRSVREMLENVMMRMPTVFPHERVLELGRLFGWGSETDQFFAQHAPALTARFICRRGLTEGNGLADGHIRAPLQIQQLHRWAKAVLVQCKKGLEPYAWLPNLQDFNWREVLRANPDLEGRFITGYGYQSHPGVNGNKVTAPELKAQLALWIQKLKQQGQV